ncbi:MBL fold metallo-hydrolase [Dermacoccaceae bacterium W4C1]
MSPVPLTSTTETVRPIARGRILRAVAASAQGALRPRRPTAGEISDLPLADLPAARRTVTLTALPQLPRTLRTPLIVEGVRSPSQLNIGLRTYVVQHPQAKILLDPSVPIAMRDRALGSMPGPLRAAVTPPADILSTVEALHLAGMGAQSFDFALPTHLHWDHVSGLLDLPHLAAVVHQREWNWAMGSEQPPVAGVRPALRDRQIRPYALDGPPVASFGASHDLFGDGAVVLVDLAGHTPGSVGVLLATQDGPVLVAGDAAWHQLQIEHCASKAAFPGLLVDEDREQTYQTLLRLNAIRKNVLVLPTHDHDLASRFETPRDH